MKTLILIVSLCLIASSAVAGTTYYVAANGDDTATGLGPCPGAGCHPWLHAPGMRGCASTCNSTTINAGDSVILRGGDTWYFNGAGTPVGLPWVWYPGFSGTSNDARIYLGVDKSWYSGGSWAQPKLSGGNPPSTSKVSSCTYTNSLNSVCVQNGSVCAGDNDCPSGWGCGLAWVRVPWSQYVTVDNFEFTGMCMNTDSDKVTTYLAAGQNGQPEPHALYAKNLYFHGYTEAAPVTGDALPVCIAGQPGNDSMIETCNFDFTDSRSQKVNAIWAAVIPDVHGNRFRNCMNNIDGPGCKLIYGNDIADAVGDFQHADIVQCEPPGNNILYIYNNIIRRWTDPVEFLTYQVAGRATYAFNNVIWGPTSVEPFDVAHGTYGLSSNNTFASLNAQIGGPISAWNGDVKNNLWIDMPNPGWAHSTGTVTEANSLYLSTAQANTAGYTCDSTKEAAGTCYRQLSATCNSNPSLCGVGQGANLTNTLVCSDDTGASCSTLGASCGTGSGHCVTLCSVIPAFCQDILGNARPSSGAWDIGAYQYGSQSGSSTSGGHVGAGYVGQGWQ